MGDRGVREREGERERGAHGSKGGFASLALKFSYLEILIIAIYMQKRLWDSFLHMNTYSCFATKSSQKSPSILCNL